MRRRVVVHGRVQGVGFRWAVARSARSRGVAGWVTNRPRIVEAVFEGAPADIEALVLLCREGPRGAEVTGLEEHDEPDEGLDGFEIR